MRKFKKLSLSKNEKLLLLVNGLYVLTGIFINTFIIARFINLTNDYLKTVSLFFIIVFGLRTIGGFFVGAYIKNLPERKNKVLTIGMLIRALFVFTIIILNDNFIKYYILLAVIYALSEMCYHFPNDSISIKATNLDNRTEYYNFKGIITNVITLLLPILLATTITKHSFNIVGIFILIFCILGAIFSYFLEGEERVEFYDFENEENNQRNLFRPQTFIKRIHGDKLTLISEYLTAALFYGLFESAFQVLFIYSIMTTFKSLVSLGIIVTIMSSFSLIILTLYNKYYQRYEKKCLIICCILVFIASLALMYNMGSKIAVIIFGICFSSADTIFGAMYSTCKGNVSNNYNLRVFFAEYMALQTIYQNIGRTISFVLILITSLIKMQLLFRISVIVMGFFGVLCAIILDSIIKEIGSNRFH